MVLSTLVKKIKLKLFYFFILLKFSQIHKEISNSNPRDFVKIEQDHSSDSTIENFPFGRREPGKA